MTDCLLVYITASGKAEAEMLGRTLVEERLAACVNIFEGVSSLYWWQGNLDTAEETLCVLKTTTERFPELSRRAKELHSYDTPCIVALPLVYGDADYLDWIRAETRSSRD
ncbi:divalent-cation tolerance protein CutA [Desulfovibrio sp. OttesenSCG-928-I05]|nr:divalent-cation tolerance protein CutA [Desulfovibrio sp. OttesenSCG-928-I05]